MVGMRSGAQGCNSQAGGDAAPWKEVSTLEVGPVEDAAEQLSPGIQMRAGLFPRS